MKITVYELLGLIKDDKAPNKIIYDNYIWNWTNDDYVTETNVNKEQFLITGMYYTWLTGFLNDEVEIIEEKENNKIEKLEIVNNGSDNSYALLNEYGTKCGLTKHSKIMCNKINELIDVINELRGKDES